MGRLASYMTKAVREAKVHTSWIHENEEYGRAVEHFVSRTLTGRKTGRAFWPPSSRFNVASLTWAW